MPNPKNSKLASLESNTIDLQAGAIKTVHVEDQAITVSKLDLPSSITNVEVGDVYVDDGKLKVRTV